VRRRLTLGFALATLLALPSSAGAVIPGENGRIVFTSGRTAGDAQAQLFLLPVPGSTGGGTISPPITSGATQHRHPTWSPDRTRIAYARGNPATSDFDIFVQDLTDPGSAPVNITNSNNVTDDRPAWAPDGERIAYESEVTDGSGQMDVLVRNASGAGPVTNFTNTTTAGQFEGKPAWTPSSATLIYQKGNPNAPGNTNIVRRPVAGGAETLAVADSGISEFQPSVSPDGTSVCFTLSNNGFNNSAEVLVAPLTTPPSGGLVVSRDLVAGDYNCAFSPDGTLVAYVNGTFSTGQLVMVRADNTSPFPIPLAQDPGGNDFDGNPDWAPDARPVCPDTTLTVPVNQAVTFAVKCTDTGPEYERTEVREFSATSPANGTVTQELAGDPMTYTPNQDFTGTDSFQVRSFDALGFGTDVGTVTINVRQDPTVGGGGAARRCGGRPALVVGASGNVTIVGTSGGDVIAGLGSNDRISAGRGNDVICGGGGRDRLAGGRGNDRVFGNSASDTLNGGRGRDRMKGGSGRDRLGAGPGRDRLSGEGGRDRLNGGSARDICRGGRDRDRASRCELRSSIP
jgi:Tol biopolymer transport system component